MVHRRKRIRFEFKAGVAALLVGVVVGTIPAWADFWSDAGAKFEGVTLHGVTESTPPSNYIKDVLAPAFEEATGIKVEIETTSWDQMYDKAIKDMEAGTGIYDMVYIEQDIIYAYLSRNFLVDITKALKDDPVAQGPGLRRGALHHLRRLLPGRRRRPLRRADGSLHQALPLPDRPLQRPGDPGRLQGEDRQGPDAGDDPRGIHRRSPSSSPSGARDKELWGTTAQAHTGHPASWYEFFESIAPTFGVYNWGIDADNNYAASVANGGRMNCDEAKAALNYWLHLRDIAPPEAAASTWTEVGDHLRRRPRRPGPRLRRERRLDRLRPGEVQGRRQRRRRAAARPSPACWRRPRPARATSATTTAAPSAVPVTSKNQEAALLFLQYIGQDSVQADWAVAAPRITNTATYDDPEVVAMDAKLGGYYTMLRDQGKLFAGAPPYPFHAQVREATAPIFYQILTGEIEPDAGLDQMAAEAEAELTNLGYRQ